MPKLYNILVVHTTTPCSGCCWMQAISFKGQIVSLFVALGYVNLSLNPFIYAARYEVVKKSWKDVWQKITR